MELTIQNLTRRYGDKTAVDGVNLTLTPGVWGLLGANGAGKTTLMRMLAGILTPTDGRVLCDGVDTRDMGEAWRDMLGYLPQSFGFYPEFTVADYLDYMAALKGIEKRDARERIGELCETLSLTRVYKSKIKKLSGGTQRRVGIAQALLNDPDVLILDEPTSGLDPAERMRLRDVLGALSTRSTVLLSTHIVSDLSVVANEVILLNSGAVIAFDSPANLLSPLRGRVWQVSCGSEAEAEFTGRYPCSGVRRDMGVSTLRLISDEPPSRDALEAEPNMEDMYLWYFKR